MNAIEHPPALAGDARDLAPVATSPMDLPVALFAEALNRRKTNRDALVAWVRASLVEGVDYGKIHSVGKTKCQFAMQNRAADCPNPAHWSKPSLWKPGAEKITGMLGVTAHYPSLAEYEKAAIGGVDIKSVILRCELRDAGGRVLSDGVGARILEKEYGDINKCLKMAEKSALIDATLRLAGLSEVFTQDLEDMETKENHGPTAAETQPQAPKPPQPVPPPGQTIGNGASKRQIEARIVELKLDRERVKKFCADQFQAGHFSDLQPAQADRLMQFLPRMASRAAREALLAVIAGAQNTTALNSILSGRKDYPTISDIDWDTFIAPTIDARWAALDAEATADA